MSKTQRQSTLLRMSRMSRRSMLIVAAFALVFVGLGSLYVGKSLAYTDHNCPDFSYSTANAGTYKYCVFYIQQALTNIHYSHPNSVADPLGTDGRYGSNTANSVRSLERYTHIYPDGVVTSVYYGGQVWGKLCTMSPNLWWQIGCNHLQD